MFGTKQKVKRIMTVTDYNSLYKTGNHESIVMLINELKV